MRTLKSFVKAKLSSPCSFFLGDNSIIAEINNDSKYKYYFVVSGKKYPFEKGIAYIPYSKTVAKLIKNSKFSIQTVFLGKTINTELQKPNIHFYDDVFFLNGIKHKEQLDTVIEIESTSLINNCFCINYNAVTLNAKDIAKVCIINDEYKIVDTLDVYDNCIIIQNIKRLFESNEKVRVLPFWNNGYFSFAGNTIIEQDFILYVNNGSLYLEHNKPSSNKPEKPTYPKLYTESRCVRPVSITEENDLVITINEKYVNNTIIIYARSSRTNRKSIIKTESSNRHIRLSLEKDFSEMLIDKCEKLILEYELLDKNNNIIEANYLLAEMNCIINKDKSINNKKKKLILNVCCDRILVLEDGNSSVLCYNNQKIYDDNNNNRSYYD